MSDLDRSDASSPEADIGFVRQGVLGGRRSAAQMKVDEEFASFYRSTIRQLIAFLLNQGAALPLAVDIAQDAMIEAYRRWMEIGHPRAYVHTVASRALVRKVADVREEPAEQTPEPTALLPCPDAAAGWELRHDMLPLLRSLPPRQRQVLAWTLNGFTPAEIARTAADDPQCGQRQPEEGPPRRRKVPHDHRISHQRRGRRAGAVTTHHRPHHDHSTIGRRLDEHQSGLVDDLGAVLDIDAGLREILLQSRHTALVDDLGAILDVDAGLAAILPAPVPPAPIAQPRPDTTVQDQSTAEQFLQSVSPQDRLMLRGHPDVEAASQSLTRAWDLAGVLDCALHLARRLGRVPGSSPARELARGHNPSLARDLSISLDLARDLARELAFDLDRGRDCDLARDIVHNLIRHLHLDDTSLLAYKVDCELALAHDLIEVCRHRIWKSVGVVLGRDVPVLDEWVLWEFLDDFTTSDLRTVVLTGVDLTGVRWSERGTLWPEDVDVEDLKARSEETPQGSGIYVIRSGSATVRDLANLR
ncbi:sigma-70 family RNA polymerase sigma factor [Thermopolyspora sp. NPDC052614]|uniref:RNA polymerase sigma factor n=1 Tax=Thermopolyspora sp. NPDC052614 TaxID=3155682 RepID=UPI0034279E04